MFIVQGVVFSSLIFSRLLLIQAIKDKEDKERNMKIGDKSIAITPITTTATPTPTAIATTTVAPSVTTTTTAPPTATATTSTDSSDTT